MNLAIIGTNAKTSQINTTERENYLLVLFFNDPVNFKPGNNLCECVRKKEITWKFVSVFLANRNPNQKDKDRSNACFT